MSKPKTCGNCANCNTRGSGTMGYLRTCVLTGLVVSSVEPACESHKFQPQKTKYD